MRILTYNEKDGQHLDEWVGSGVWSLLLSMHCDLVVVGVMALMLLMLSASRQRH